MLVYTHPSCLLHDPGAGHPESPERLRVLLDRLVRDGGHPLREADPAPLDALRAVHPAEYLEFLRNASQRGGGALDPDTVVSRDSWDAALGSAGACLAALRSALDGAPAFAAVRPPGHHALADRAMGFCLLANAVIVARAAQRQGREKVLIVDWDVHHGNGTQALMQHDPSLRYVSLHQWPAYPGTGRADERGVGNVFNLPMAPGLPPGRYVEALWADVVRATEGWTPRVVVVSAGFDGMAGDPLGGFTLEPMNYADLTRRIRDRLPDAGFVSLLEGGYAPDRLADGVMAHLAAA
jgi:acetoin utilization deacetylase AcuC-like enzyme